VLRLKGVVEALDNWTEEYSDTHVGPDQDSNVGLVIDGEVSRNLSVDQMLFVS